MSLKKIGHHSGLSIALINSFVLLLVLQSPSAITRFSSNLNDSSYRVKKSGRLLSSVAAEDFQKLLREAKRLYFEMDYEGAIQKLNAAQGAARSAMEKADLNFYLSLAYYATLGESDRSELLSTIEKVLVFDYQREPDPNVCPSGYVEIFNELKASFGAVKILSHPPGADVYINSNLEGKTPLTVGAKAGPIEVVVKKGKVEKQDQLEVTAGQVMSSPIYELVGKKGKFPIAIVLGGVAVAGGAAAFLLKGAGKDGEGVTTGTILVNSSPTGAKIFLDGTDTGKVTNTSLTNIAAGSHTVKLTKDGYSDREQSVTVTAGQTEMVDLTLTKDTITVSQPASGSTWLIGSSVEIKWQVSAGSTVQFQPRTEAFSGRGLQDRYRFNAQKLRATREIAGQRRTNSGSFARAEGERGLDRGKSYHDYQGVQGHSEAPATGRLERMLGKTIPFSPNRAANSRLGLQTSVSARVLVISKIKIELYKGSTLAETIASETENDGIYTWQVSSSLASGSDYKVRVSCSSDANVYGDSALITICKASEAIIIKQPAAGALWNKGQSYSIKWTSSLGGNVKIDLCKSADFVRTIISSVRNDGEYYWAMPTSLADGSDYNILITSLGTSAVSGRSGNFTIVHGYEFVTKWGTYGSGNGQFDGPIGIALDGSGNVYVVEDNNHRVQKFTSGGSFLAKWGTPGSGDGQLYLPKGLAIYRSGEQIYIADSGNSRIQKFTSGGSFLTKWGIQGSGDGQFINPEAIAVDNSGSVDAVFVVDMGNHRIQKFNSSGGFITKWGTKGNGSGQFNTPYGITVDSSGYVYVADRNNNRIQKFNSEGVFITKWGTQGEGDGQFASPEGIAADSDGNIYVADSYNHRIQKFNSEGVFITRWGSRGSEDGQFFRPVGIDVDTAGNVYVVDRNNNRIQKFRKVG